MPYVDQIILGWPDGRRNDARTVLAQSPGMDPGAVAAVRRLADSWGSLPPAGLSHPALAAAPLEPGRPGGRGRTWAVLRLAAGESGLVHAFVLGDAEYAASGRHPLRLAAHLPFVDTWIAEAGLGRAALPDAAAPWSPSPAPSRSDQALVTEAVRQVLVSGSLILPLAQPCAEADRALGLVAAALPAQLRAELRFATWAGNDANRWTVAAVGRPDCAFAGWQRLLMAEVAAIVPERVEAYARAVGERLAAGDAAGLASLPWERESSRGNGAKPAARPRVAAPDPDPVLTTSSVAEASAPPPAPRAAGIHPARRGQHAASAAAAVETNVETPRPPRRRSAAGLRRPRLRPARRSRLGRIAPLVAWGLVVAAAAWWQMPRIAAWSGDRLGWFGAGRDAAADAAPSLLRVVDVGAVYRRSLQAVGRAESGGLLPGGDDDQRRRRACLTFQGEAAGPLLEQVDLFAELAAEGIQQGGRPDREVARLHALAAQGEVLEQEMRRLELGWYSLDAGADWRDLPDLSDAAVAARRDSLKRAAGPALTAASREVGTAAAWGRIRNARLQMAGMAGLLEAFEADHWSQAWEDRLFAAAERVAPSASPTTRAYRNSAFALVRLKRAERTEAARDLPFAADFGDGRWPAPAVGDVLADLRREVGRFGAAGGPPVAAGTVALYDALARADDLASHPDRLKKLAANPAVRFDPEAYADYLDRVRCEADWARLAAAAADSGGAGTGVDDAAGLLRFRHARDGVQDAAFWRAEAGLQQRPFLARWAGRLAAAAEGDRGRRLAAFQERWQACRGLRNQVAGRAAAGGDWTAAWCDLRDQTAALCGDYARGAGGDPELAAGVTAAADLLAALKQPRSLGLQAVTVRCGPGAFEAPGEVMVQLLVPGAAAPLPLAPVRLGPAAPAGSGWVGTASVDWRAVVSPHDELTVRVLDKAGRELMTTRVPSLADRGGPGALARPRGEGAVTASFRLDPSWWTGLELP